MYSCRYTYDLEPTHFHCIRYIGPPSPPLMGNFDKKAVYYKFEDENGLTVAVMPLAFTWTEEEENGFLVLPLWMKKVKDFRVLKFEKVIETEVIEFEGTLKLKWFANLKPNSSLPVEDILPQIFGGNRPLCNGTILPFSFGGMRFLLKIEGEGIEDGKVFWFNLETGSLDFSADVDDDDDISNRQRYSQALEVLKNGSWKGELKVLKHQLNKEQEEKEIFLIFGVPLLIQKEFIKLLEIDYEPIQVSNLISEEHLQIEESFIDEETVVVVVDSIIHVLGEVDSISSNLMTEIIKNIKRKKTIFMTSKNSIETSTKLLKLEKSAHLFNFQVLNFKFPVPNEIEKFEILKRENGGVDFILKSFKFLNFCDFLRILKASEISKLSENSEIINSVVVYPFYGYKKIRREIQNLIKGPLINSEAYERFGLPKSSGFLIFGPTGCGKTSLCLNILTDKEFNQNFTIFHIPTASKLLSKYFGETEANIRKLFAEARERKPSIIFIDQIETLGKKRGSDENGAGGGGDASERYLSTLLNEMDGISGNEGVTILTCANDIKMLDEALLRPGRLDRHFYMGLPDETDRREIINGFSDDISSDLDEFIEETDGWSGAEIKAILKKLAINK